MSSEIPAGWSRQKINDAAHNVTRKYQLSPGYNPRYIGLEHLKPDTKSVMEWGFAQQITSSKTQFQKGDTLFGKLRPYLKKVALAEFDGICSTDILAIRPRKGVHAGFLYRVLSTDETIAAATGSSVGNVMPRTSWGSLGEVDFLEPPYPEQQKIATILSSVDEVIEKSRAQIDKLKDLKTGMMQELLTQGIGHTEFKDSPVGRIPVNWDVVPIKSIVEKVIDNRGKTPPKSNAGFELLVPIQKQPFCAPVRDHINAGKTRSPVF